MHHSIMSMNVLISFFDFTNEYFHSALIHESLKVDVLKFKKMFVIVLLQLWTFHHIAALYDDMFKHMTDRHHCVKSFARIEVSQIYFNLVTVVDLRENRLHKKVCWRKSVLHGVYPFLPPTTVLGHAVVQRLLCLPECLRCVVLRLARENRNADF